jgi:hypothetical protein
VPWGTAGKKIQSWFYIHLLVYIHICSLYRTRNSTGGDPGAAPLPPAGTKQVVPIIVIIIHIYKVISTVWLNEST